MCRNSLLVSCSTQRAEIRIKDSGIGIPPESLSRIFDVFSQIDDVRTRNHGGLGSGLSIVKSLVTMHEGSVEVRSERPGQGTEFVVRLPTVVNQLSLVQGENSSMAMEPASDSRRVLVVDDNQDSARTMAMVLDLFGCTCQTVFDGVTALRLADEFAPHVFVLDLGMAGMSGLDLARNLRAQPRFQNAILIAVTGWDKDEDRRRSKEAGFDDHFAKPVDIGLINDILRPSNGAPNLLPALTTKSLRSACSVR